MADLPSLPPPPTPGSRAPDHPAFGPPDPTWPPLLSELAPVALEVAQGVASLLGHAFGQSRSQVDTKSSATDMVSEVDRAAEAFVSSRLAEARPDDGILGEEGASRSGTTGVRWVIDPLDGTTNFLFGVPAYCVSLAAELDGRPVVGVVIDPSRHETWAAAEGRGAWRNGVRCQVADGRSELSTALVATGFGYLAPRRSWQAGLVASILPAVRDIRRFGSAALDLCWVGGGRFDAYYEWGLNPWDLSAGSLICSEAGARVEILAGRTILAAAPALFDPLADLLARAGALDPPDGAEQRTW